jgi:poly-gamma-glutamate capsule biosynthesis protein CapA/YwtB (metallophosphatase superfamily)
MTDVRPSLTGRIAFTGDTFLAAALSGSASEETLSIRSVLQRCDSAFTNLETLFHRFESPPMAESGGTYSQADPVLAGELTWLGLNLISTAHNHAGDYGADGLLSSLSHLRAHGFRPAGAGPDLSTAAAPTYVRSRNGDRIALVAATATFPRHSCAADGSGVHRPRPGINPLRYDLEFVVPADDLNAIHSLADRLQTHPRLTGDGRVHAFRTHGHPEGYVFAEGDGPRQRSSARALDLDRLAASVAAAAEKATPVIASLHVHESGEGGLATPPGFLVQVAHALVDAGADVVVGHGPHVLRGVERYRDSIIFYSLGNFVFQTQLMQHQPDRADGSATGAKATLDFTRYRGFWQSAVAVVEWVDGRLTDVSLIPVALSGPGDGEFDGTPRLANAALRAEVTGRLIGMSAELATPLVDAGDCAKVLLQ